MKFSDFPKEQVILAVSDALDELSTDYDIHAYPYFFDRLRSALEYLDISSESIEGLNFDNQESYLGALYDLWSRSIYRSTISFPMFIMLDNVLPPLGSSAEIRKT